MKKSLLFLFLFSFSAAFYGQKINYVSYYTLKGCNSGTEIPLEQLKQATGFDTTALAKEYKIYGIEYVGTIGKKRKAIQFGSTRFNAEMMKILREAKAGDKLYFDFKVKDKTGKVISLPTHYFKVS